MPAPEAPVMPRMTGHLMAGKALRQLVESRFHSSQVNAVAEDKGITFYRNESPFPHVYGINDIAEFAREGADLLALPRALMSQKLEIG